MNGEAATVAARELGNERVQSIPEMFRDVSVRAGLAFRSTWQSKAARRERLYNSATVSWLPAFLIRNVCFGQ